MEEVIDDTLKQHISFGLSRGRTPQQLTQLLTSAGWPEEIITKYLEQVQHSQEASALLHITNLTKKLGNKTILNNITLDIKPGEIIGIIGKSGSGKTTLLHTIAGILTPDTGEVILQTENNHTYSAYRNPEQAKSMIGLSTQQPSFYDKLTVKENIHHYATLHNIPKEERNIRTNTVLKQMDLWTTRDQYAIELSGGQQKQLDIACAIIHKPHILLLDEPTASLDPISAQKLYTLITQINQTGTTIILASHLLNDLDQHCDRIAILHNNTITTCAPPEDLKKLLTKHYTLTIKTQSGDTTELTKQFKQNTKLYNIINTRPLTITTTAPKHALNLAAQLIKNSPETLSSLTLTRPTLQDIFDKLTKK